MAKYIPVELVRPNPQQPRKVFDQEALEGLAGTIKKHGVLQPITVYPDSGLFILIDGERRWRAAILAGKKRIRADIRRKPVEGVKPEAADRSRLEKALIANVQRADIGPVEEGQAFLKLVEEFGLSQAEVARKLGISPARVNNSILFARADKEIGDLIEEGKLYQNIDLVRALMQIPDRKVRIAIAGELATKKPGLKASIRAARTAAEACKDRGAVKDGKKARPMAHAPGRPRASEKPRQWDALQQVGRVPPWELMVEAVRETCEKCPLADIASSDTCGQCPAVDLLEYLLRAGNEDDR